MLDYERREKEYLRKKEEKKLEVKRDFYDSQLTIKFILLGYSDDRFKCYKFK